MKSETKTSKYELKPLVPDLTPEEIAQQQKDLQAGFLVICCLLGLMFYCATRPSSTLKNPPKIGRKRVLALLCLNTGPDFTPNLSNNNNSVSTMKQAYIVSARWDLLIRLPGKFVGGVICLRGNLHASFLYKNVTLATSSIHSYNKLELDTPQLLNISAVASEEDMSGAIGKEIMEAIKDKSEVRFGSRLSLTDCREDTKNGTMSYECDEATLRFEPNSNHSKATSYGNHATCIISP